MFEGERASVIGEACGAVADALARDPLFGCSCANDVTLADTLNRKAPFAQGSRAEGFDTFCPMGPVAATGLDPSTLSVTTLLNGERRQHVPVSDRRFSVAQRVSLIAFDLTPFPGGVIRCGTSVGVGRVLPDRTVEVDLSGIGKLGNRLG